MKRIELLAPAGTMEALKAAVFNGADAIYCGGSNFGARAHAGNFNHDEIKTAINFCHHYGVKIYITMNTLIYENEFDSAIQEVSFYYENNADALIIQDLGLFDYVRKVYPSFEIHCSTQMHIHNLEGVRFMKEKGASRVVLARESSIELIEMCTKEDLEIEIFTYGALCVSYSGQCLMSSLTLARSGNRGTCAQCCRMQYDLMDIDKNKILTTPGKYLLSPKDLNVIDQLPRLIEAGVASLKIEGRMKRPEYVALIVKTFREAIDSYYNHKQYRLTQQRFDELKLMFNRQFTKGHIFHDSGLQLMNPSRPNHMGLILGKVIKATKDHIDVKLDIDLYQHDGLRILDEKEDIGFTANKIYLNEQLVNHARAGSIVTFDCPYFVKNNSLIVKTTDTKLIDSLDIHNVKFYQSIPLDFKIIAKINEPFVIIAKDNHGNIVEEASKICCQKALSKTVTKEQFYDQINKLKETPYYIDKFDGIFEEVFIPLKEINDVRRILVEKMNICRENVYQRKDKKEYQTTLKKETLTYPTVVEVNTEEQALLLKDSPVLLFSSKKELLSQHSFVYPMNFVVNENSNYNNGHYTLINEIGNLNHGEGNMIASAHLNITNSYALSFLMDQGVSLVCLSHELDVHQTKELIKKFHERFGFEPPISIFRYGYRDLMITKVCIINEILADGTKKNCSLCHNHRYGLIGIKGNLYRFMKDDTCIQHILEEEPYQNDENSGEAVNWLRLTFENSDETKLILQNHIL